MRKLFKLLNNIRKKDSGQGLVEYGLILALVSIVSIATLGVLGGAIQDNFEEAVVTRGGNLPVQEEVVSQTEFPESGILPIEMYKYSPDKSTIYGLDLSAIGAMYGANIPANLGFPSENEGIPLTSIGEYKLSPTHAIRELKSLGLVEITIPDTVTTISESAFEGNHITKVNFPSGLKSIGIGAFRDNKITTLNLPDGLISVGDSAFENNPLSGLLTIPFSVRTIGNWSFKNVIPSASYPDGIGSKLTLVEIPDNTSYVEHDGSDLENDLSDSSFNYGVTIERVFKGGARPN